MQCIVFAYCKQPGSKNSKKVSQYIPENLSNLTIKRPRKPILPQADTPK